MLTSRGAPQYDAALYQKVSLSDTGRPKRGAPIRHQALCLRPITELSSLLESRELSPVELVDAHLERIDALEETLNAFITVARDEAKAAAREAERAISRGEYRGPLHGIPVGLKDLFATKGLRTTSGTTVWAHHVPSEDAFSVARLKNAGAIIVGKLNMNELAFGATGENAHYGDSCNPWAPELMSGGSSGGSAAATAAGECAAALGTDTGGSGRIPASLCGLVGLKPNYGRISQRGVTQLCWSLDHVSIFARTVADSALVLNALAGYDPQDPTSADLPAPDFTTGLEGGATGLRVGVPREFVWDALDPEVEAAVGAAIDTLAGLGATIVEVSIPSLPTAIELAATLMGAEAFASHGALLEAHAEEIDPRMRPRLAAGGDVTASDYIKAQKARSALTREVLSALRDVHVLAFATTVVVAPRRGETDVQAGGAQLPVLNALGRLNRVGNLTGYPSISLPCGFSGGGLPIGFQLMGRPFEEVTLLQAANAYERATGWHDAHPAVAVRGEQEV